MQISSIILAKNEETNILRCIQSQKDIIEDIIILVDKTSTDKTLDIVASCDWVRYEEVEWKGYAATKTHGIELAKHNWIFWIDADEALTPQLKEEILSFKKSQPDHVAYSVPRKAYFLGRWIKHSGWYPGRVLRLFNKQHVHFSDSKVHEHLIVNGSTGKLQYPLDHFTDPNIEHYYIKFNRYTTLAALELKNKKKKPSGFSMFLRATIMFVKMYILKRGFLDGTQGLILAVFSANYVFTKYAKLWEIQNNQETDE